MTPERTRIFERLLEQRERIFVICLGFARTAQDAEEWTQEIYMKACDGFDSLKDPGAALGWLLRIARNTCRDHLKRERVRRSWLRQARPETFSAAHETPEARLERHRNVTRLRESIRLLSVKQREVLVLREYGDLSYREIASLLGIRQGTVMSRLNRARLAVAEMVKGERT